MNIKKKLQNPFVLAGQGFVAGAILFWTTAPDQNDPNRGTPLQTAAIAKSIDA